MENLLEDTESFVGLKCFEKLDREFVMALHDNSEPRLCYPNQVLIKEHALGDEMFILRSGKVSVLKGGKFMAELHSGVVIGELAVMGTDKRRTATVVCSSLCLIRVVHGDIFHGILTNFPCAKYTFDNAYITRLVYVDMQHAKEELRSLDQSLGSAHPKTTSQCEQLFMGATRQRVAREPHVRGSQGSLSSWRKPQKLTPLHKQKQSGTALIEKVPTSTRRSRDKDYTTTIAAAAPP